MKPHRTELNLRFGRRQFAPALAATALAGDALLPRDRAAHSIPRFHPARHAAARPSRVEPLLALHTAARRRAEFWENLVFGLLGVCALAAVTFSFFAGYQ